MIIFFVLIVCFLPSSPVISTLPGSASRPVPLKRVIEFFFIKYSIPFEFFITTLSLRFCTSAKAS